MRYWFKYTVYLSITLCICFARADALDDFFRAVAGDDEATVQSLLARGFDPNSVEQTGQGALHVAVRNGSRKAFGALLAHRDTKVDQPNAADETPLMIAALIGDLGAVQGLLERRAQVQRAGWSPLHYAATGPSTEVAALLLKRGADLEARSPNGSTALMMAARYGPERSALMLLEQGADVSRRNDRGLTAADFARLAGRSDLGRRLEPPAR